MTRPWKTCWTQPIYRNLKAGRRCPSTRHPGTMQTNEDGAAKLNRLNSSASAAVQCSAVRSSRTYSTYIVAPTSLYCWPLSPPLGKGASSRVISACQPARLSAFPATQPATLWPSCKSHCWQPSPPQKSGYQLCHASRTSAPLHPFSLPLANATGGPA